jgi:hypothetical protein
MTSQNIDLSSWDTLYILSDEEKLWRALDTSDNFYFLVPPSVNLTSICEPIV